MEDDDFVLEAVAIMATRLGHRVLRAHDCEQAVILMNAWHQYIQTIVLDWSLPCTIIGGQLVETFHKIDPEVPVIVMSGFPEKMVRASLPKDSEVQFLQKPFLVHELENAIRTAQSKPDDP